MTGVLASILDPLTPEQFRDEYYAQKPVHIAGPSDSQSGHRFSSLFNWDSLNRVLNCSPAPHPTLRLVLDANTLTAGDAAAVLAQIRKGATMVVAQLDRYDPQIAAFAASLAHELGERVQVNVYVSPPAKLGFKRHYDTSDHLVLQLTGARRWQVFEPTVASPLWNAKRPATSSPEEAVLECTLEPGDVLYVPRGHWHEALVEDEITAHLTVAIHPRTGIDYLAWLMEKLKEDNRWRKELPLIFADEEDGSVARQLFSAHLAALHAMLRRELTDAQLPDRYEQASRAGGQSETRFCFPEQFSA